KALRNANRAPFGVDVFRSGVVALPPPYLHRLSAAVREVSRPSDGPWPDGTCNAHPFCSQNRRRQGDLSRQRYPDWFDKRTIRGSEKAFMPQKIPILFLGRNSLADDLEHFQRKCEAVSRRKMR